MDAAKVLEIGGISEERLWLTVYSAAKYPVVPQLQTTEQRRVRCTSCDIDCRAHYRRDRVPCLARARRLRWTQVQRYRSDPLGYKSPGILLSSIWSAHDATPTIDSPAQRHGLHCPRDVLTPGPVLSWPDNFALNAALLLAALKLARVHCWTHPDLVRISRGIELSKEHSSVHRHS